MSGTLLSAALIVRDEERFLEGCLLSLKGRVDDIVVVDTGSTDRSCNIARDLGARVVSHVWTDDFAAARNASIDGALGEWILYIDADERVVEFDREAVDALIADPRHICHTVLFRPAAGYTRYREYRLFRKHPDLRFRGVIHESLVPALDSLCAGRRWRIGDSPVALDHLGYEGDLRHKHLRNLPLLEARLERDPQHVYCWDQLGLARRGLGNEPGAEEAWRRAIAIVAARQTARPLESLPYLHLADLLLTQKRNAAAVLDEGCRKFPENHSLSWLRARQLLEAGNCPAAMPLFARLAGIDGASLAAGPIAFDASIFGAQAYAALGLCAYRLGRLAESLAHYARAAALAPDNLELRAKHAVAAMRAKVPIGADATPR